MKYMPIVPIGMQDLFDRGEIENCFLLAQYWKHKEYREFYSSKIWDTVILDNAVYENSTPLPVDQMMEIAEDIEADQLFIVSPENQSDGMKTAQLTSDMINEYGAAGDLNGTPWNIMTILHELPNEMKAQYQWMQENLVEDIKDVAIGISIFSARHGFDRASLLKFCGVNPNDHPYVHAFGLDNILEILNLRDSGFESVDSSFAVTTAVRGIDYRTVWNIPRNPNSDPNGRYAGNKIRRVDLMETEFTGTVKSQTLWNIQEIQQICEDGVIK